ncbi:ribosome-assembly protein 3-domain-containing protein [Triangularia verruculosa]|uniref:Ribosome assembly protein 3 n=1 Tax=Triangularia verruculosa TaxID=2587418 RepID=A0AAN6X6I7_9PEZI|nr:ribosome-assembly protein 3-domain-containing protein [Triangularia verruculosa]
MSSSSPEPQQQQQQQQQQQEQQKTEQKSQKQIDDEFTSYYLQRATKEFGEALDAVRSADDFKSESSVAVLISALQQGTEMFSGEERRGVICAEGRGRGRGV